MLPLLRLLYKGVLEYYDPNARRINLVSYQECRTAHLVRALNDCRGTIVWENIMYSGAR
jgi:hypothetical protein